MVSHLHVDGVTSERNLLALLSQLADDFRCYNCDNPGRPINPDSLLRNFSRTMLEQVSCLVKRCHGNVRPVHDVVFTLLPLPYCSETIN